MNTPPKASRFRIRKVVAPQAAQTAQPAQRNADMPFAPVPEDDGFGDLNLVNPPDKRLPPLILTKEDEAEIAAVRAEGLSARQLRLARRAAARQGIEAGSDYEAVVRLRQKKLDPFQRQGVLHVVRNDEAAPGADQQSQYLPSTENKAVQLPSLAVDAELARISAIREMQRDIVRRRHRNFLMLMVRLAFFVFLPTVLAGYYYAFLATPLYSTTSQFLIQQAEPPGGMGGLGNMFKGTTFATSQDAIAVQSYLQSRDAMLRLDQTEGFKSHFSQEYIDPLQRLDPNATNEAAYSLYRRNVKIGYDPTEGIIKMEVVAADPAKSEAFSKALLRFAEQQVDSLTQRVREDQMKGARESYADAEAKVQAAQNRVLELQKKLGVLDPKVESTMAMGQVADLESVLRQKQLQLSQLLDNAKPNQARVDGVRGDIERLNKQVSDLRTMMTVGDPQSASLAEITGELRIADTELQTRQAMLGQALQQVETARIEANRQVRYLSMSVAPVAPDEPTYPLVFEDTALAFLVFAGIYLMLSLTASILREQVTS